MADIFISYAREDRAIAERLASAIEASGKTVWWDRHIKGGAQFSKDIERELAAARFLILWRKASIDSRWTRDDATEATRADPRSQAAFEIRHERGVAQGRPVFSVKPYEGE